MIYDRVYQQVQHIGLYLLVPLNYYGGILFDYYLHPTKQLMCYLIALDLNDEEMMFRVTGKKLQTVQRYLKECEELMEQFK